MIKEIHVDTLDEVMEILAEQDYREDIDRYRSQFLYRGMANSCYKLETSLTRNCKELQKELEMPIIKNFAKYAAIEDPSIGDSVWKQMILGQHHGLPTRLLDWSHSALVGLHFSCTEDDMDKMEAHDSMIWRIDMKELHSLLPKKYLDALRTEKIGSVTYSVDILDKVTKDPAQYDEDMGDHSMVIIEPPSTDPRIVNQYSFFSIIPLGITDIESFLDTHTENTIKYVIDKNLRWRIRDMLDHLNMSERTVYPGLDGLTKWITRHYFVKPKSVRTDHDCGCDKENNK